MLCNLVVENYALIKRLDINFRQGLTIITGETGAGKSILLGALGLVLGKRADTGVLLSKDSKCLVEATFDITLYGLEPFFEQNDIDYAGQTIIRREIHPSGKSRAFINDQPVNLDVLNQLGNRLIDIHSQHQNLLLSESGFQLRVLDVFAGSQPLLEPYRLHFRAHADLSRQYSMQSEMAERLRTELDYLTFQHSQLADARLVDAEQEELEQEAEQLTHAEEIHGSITSGLMLLDENPGSALQAIKETLAQIQRVLRFFPAAEAVVGRLNSVYIELKDVTRELEILNSRVLSNPDRLATVQERLSLLFTLQKKHRVNSVTELIALREDLKMKIEAAGEADNQLDKLDARRREAAEAMSLHAEKLTHHRSMQCGAFETSIASMLKEVGMPQALFQVKMESSESFTETGCDTIRFLFSASRNGSPQEISRVASGGELSRLMLCVKSLLAGSSGMPTIIFDEIDTGVSGEIAEKVGNIIWRMSGNMQIINITHLPQVASKGQNHFLVYKTEETGDTETRMRLLTADERLVEIARMLSGEEITPAALENARTLLGS